MGESQNDNRPQTNYGFTDDEFQKAFPVDGLDGAFLDEGGDEDPEYRKRELPFMAAEQKTLRALVDMVDEYTRGSQPELSDHSTLSEVQKCFRNAIAQYAKRNIPEYRMQREQLVLALKELRHRMMLYSLWWDAKLRDLRPLLRERLLDLDEKIAEYSAD